MKNASLASMLPLIGLPADAPECSYYQPFLLSASHRDGLKGSGLPPHDSIGALLIAEGGRPGFLRFSRAKPQDLRGKNAKVSPNGIMLIEGFVAHSVQKSWVWGRAGTMYVGLFNGRWTNCVVRPRAGLSSWVAGAANVVTALDAELIGYTTVRCPSLRVPALRVPTQIGLREELQIPKTEEESDQVTTELARVVSELYYPHDPVEREFMAAWAAKAAEKEAAKQAAAQAAEQKDVAEATA